MRRGLVVVLSVFAAACGDGRPTVVSAHLLGPHHFAADREVQFEGHVRVLGSTARDDGVCGVDAADLVARLEGARGPVHIELVGGGPDGDCFLRIRVGLEETDGFRGPLALHYLGPVEDDADGDGLIAETEVSFAAPTEVAHTVNGLPRFSVLDGLESHVVIFVLDAAGARLTGVTARLESPRGSAWPCDLPDRPRDADCEPEAVRVPASAVTDGAPVVVAFEDLELRDTALVATESDITGVGFFHVTDTTTFPFDPDLRWHERLAEGPHSPTEIGAVVAAAVLADGTPVWTGELSVDVSSDGALVIGRSSLHGPRVFELARVLEQGFTHLEARYGEHLAMLSITAD